eukprot:m.249591 g.249591  ORF g.249591 m.249591 type:complete len:636 (-) comp17167_c0_seq2:531-2438(-)
MSEARNNLASMCNILQAEVQELVLTNTTYRSIQLCHRLDFENVFLQDNKRLENITIPTGLTQLNVSGCVQLRTLSLPSAEILDISNTALKRTVALCTGWGSRMLFAQNMKQEHFGSSGSMRELFSWCLPNVDVLDLSNNDWLDRPASIVSRPTVLSEAMFGTENFIPLNSRPAPVALQLSNTPIACALLLANRRLRSFSNTNMLSTELTYSFKCQCAPGYHLQDEVCMPDKQEQDIRKVVGITLAIVVGLHLVVFFAHRWYKRNVVALRKENELNIQLLSASNAEVLALKSAWEIQYSELHLLDHISAGAFGEVWKAEWDSITVAVKVLKQQFMAFDEQTVKEFEKEVEFLQKTRHPHVVRFFGAGTDPSQSPFLVLEFVALGSLRGLLQKGLQIVLDEYYGRQWRRSYVEEDADAEEDDDVVLVDSVATARFGEETELLFVSNTDGHPAERLTILTLKLQLARDIACGMAFIHSLDQVHRDLKSGNVLVSGRLRAKITDFGTIRQHLSSATLHTVTTATDLAYPSQFSGTNTAMSVTLTSGVGTPLYMAPEALSGGKYDKRADVFSYGVLLWELCMETSPDIIEQECGGVFRGPLLTTILRLLQEGKRLRFTRDRGEYVWIENFRQQELSLSCG